MSEKKTLGGDRLGSGNRMKQELHNYFRSNHNLSCARISSQAPGVLYPMYVNMGLTGDTFDIDMSAFVRTLPTEGPMFGAFKLQVDVFTADARLYQAILHNNTTEIGMNMDQVLLPKIKIGTYAEWVLNEQTGAYEWKQQISKSSLLYYLGIAGIGSTTANQRTFVQRKFNALPMLAYYDIYKNYYANKQEKDAYVIVNKTAQRVEEKTAHVNLAYFCETYVDEATCGQIDIAEFTLGAMFYPTYQTAIVLKGDNLVYYDEYGNSYPNVIISRSGGTTQTSAFRVEQKSDNQLIFVWQAIDQNSDVFILRPQTHTSVIAGTEQVNLLNFPLENIDLMRKRLLTSWDLGEEVVIDNNEELYPYKAVTEQSSNVEDNGEIASKHPMQGLVVKCYQSDMFNNWLDSEWVAKITEKSKVNVVNGSFTMDALNLAKKMYNHYNRIAITGGTYDDWQLAAYGEENYGKCEKPIYHGGMSAEVIFDEVVSTFGTADEPLGSLGGRGSIKGSRGGHVVVKCREACVLMVMVSLTPRLTYSQGNAWYNTELDSIDDLHKPEFDRIGFQDLMTEKLAWWDTKINQYGELLRTSVGKQPAWIDYQTDVDKCFADFAEENGKGFMVLQRLYDYDQQTKGVADVTTYIAPSKYNYCFANASLTSQNFWTFLSMNIKARRKMSAKQIPNF